MKSNAYTYFGVVLFLLIMTVGISLADNATIDYKSELISAIVTANDKLENAVAGTAYGQYPQSAIDAFELAIGKAQEIVDNQNVSTEQVDQAVVDLENAGEIFDAAKITTININKEALTTAIKAASAKAEAAVAGTDVGQYPQSAIDAFNKAIDTVQEVADDKTATQTEVDQAVTNLKAAQNKFDAAKITTININKEALTTAIKAAKAKAENAVAGTDTDQYPQSAIDAFNEAIASAQEIADDATANEEEVAQAVTSLKKAETNFDAAKIKKVGLNSFYVTKLEEIDTGSDRINWNWVNPTDEDFSHVMIYMNGTFVTDTSSNTSIHSYNATGLSDGATYTISIRAVDISGNISSIWVNDSATTVQLPRIYSLSGTNITNTSITLIWEASNDTTRVQISRDGIILSNVSGFTSYVDGNLSNDTTYSYTLVPYDEDGLGGKSVSVNLATGSSNSSSGGGSSIIKTSSSNGGGGGGSSSDDFANIALKDADSEYLRANANVTYEFTKTGIDILSVRFYSLKNSGEISSTVELLKNMSKLVNGTPEGVVYEYVNIWVGKDGFATAANIEDSRVKFKVNSSWIQDMGIEPTDVRLQRYNGKAWEVLPTTILTEAADYVIFESQVPGFSHFAITAEKSFASPLNSDTVKELAQAAVVSIEQTLPGKNGIWTFIKAIALVEVLSIGFEYYRRKK